ncbi:type II toxin-antitoxin system mRNA interferase toxin, HP0892 family [Helicobacter pylori]
MLEISASKKFDKKLKTLIKNGFDLKLLYAVIDTLAQEKPLETKYKDHKLKGNLKDFRECHIKPDLLLVYQVINNKTIKILHLIDLTNHNNL